MRLKEHYTRADCCGPVPPQAIMGYFSHDGDVRVHKADCDRLRGLEKGRLVILQWEEILEPELPPPGEDYHRLDEIDIGILKHHRDLGIDYSLKVAAVLHLNSEEVFDRHERLRGAGLLMRVEPHMVQYRKNITKGKWIKHRNHTYYDLAPKGRQYLEYYLKENE